MNLFRADLPDRLAAEYVLGTLTGGARRRFDALLLAHPTLARAVASWEARLLPMAMAAEPVAPTAGAWAGIEARLGWQAGAAASSPLAASVSASALDTAAAGGASDTAPAGPAASAFTRKLRFWRVVSALASLVALLLAAVLRLAPAEAPLIVVLRATSGSETLVAGLSADRRQLTIQPLQPVALRPSQSLELWALPKAGAPASLGVISATDLTALSRKDLPADTKGLAVTLEPLGGSPHGKPTGPIVFVGELTL